jgi:hypothetical protein
MIFLKNFFQREHYLRKMSNWKSACSGKYFQFEVLVEGAEENKSEKCMFLLRRGAKKGMCCGQKTVDGTPACSRHRHFFEIEVGRHGMSDDEFPEVPQEAIEKFYKQYA